MQIAGKPAARLVEEIVPPLSLRAGCTMVWRFLRYFLRVAGKTLAGWGASFKRGSAPQKEILDNLSCLVKMETMETLLVL